MSSTETRTPCQSILDAMAKYYVFHRQLLVIPSGAGRRSVQVGEASMGEVDAVNTLIEDCGCDDHGIEGHPGNRLITPNPNLSI